MENLQDFTTGSITKKLIRFCFPILLALIVQDLYGAADVFVIGRWGSTAGVSGVAVGSQVMGALTHIVSSFTMSVTILLGQKLGEKKPEEAAEVIGTGIIFFAILSVSLTVIMLCLSRTIVTAMHTPPEAFDEALAYIRICSCGLIPIIAYNAISAVMRGIGDSKSPLKFVAIACVVNILGDLLLVAVFNMNAAGAAYATVFGQLISVLLSLLIIKKRGLPFEFSAKNLHINRVMLKRLITIGSPAAVMETLTSLSFIIITTIINTLGVTASAAMGIGSKLISFMMMIPSSFMSASAAFVAQNVGAGEIRRTKQTLVTGICISAVIGLFIFLFTFFRGYILVGLFSTDPAVIDAGYKYMQAYSIDCLIVSATFCFIGFYNGYGATKFVMVQSIVQSLFVRVPFTYFMSIAPNTSMFKLGLASPVASFSGVILCLVYFFSGKWKKYSINAREE